jgi:hypothetical protein
MMINYSTFSILTNIFTEILTARPTPIGSYIISENALVKILNVEQFIIMISEIQHSKCKQCGIPYCGTGHVICIY